MMALGEFANLDLTEFFNFSCVRYTSWIDATLGKIIVPTVGFDVRVALV